MTLHPGDVIATGTPAGVGPLVPGDTVEVKIAGVGVLRNPVHAPRAVISLATLIPVKYPAWGPFRAIEQI